MMEARSFRRPYFVKNGDREKAQGEIDLSQRSDKWMEERKDEVSALIPYYIGCPSIPVHPTPIYTTSVHPEVLDTSQNKTTIR
jgi:hypothetical protein